MRISSRQIPPWTGSLPFNKFLRNCGNMPKLYRGYMLCKTCDGVPKDNLWAVLLEYDVRSQLLTTTKKWYEQSEVCVCVNDMKTKPFSVSVGLRQSCVLSLFLFIIYMDKIERDSSFSSGVTMESVMFGACCLQIALHSETFFALHFFQALIIF